MKFFITGGTGFIGQALLKRLLEAGHEISLLTRSARGREHLKDKVRLIEGDPSRPGLWQEEVVRAEAVINLAGASIFSRWSKRVKRKLLESRVLTTRRLVEAMASSKDGPQVLLSASAVGYYGFQGDEEIDESVTHGDDFLAQTCQAWEAEALKAKEAGIRVALMRFGIVLGQEGGALKLMLPLFRIGLGGRLGKGSQWFSWIHRADLVEAIVFILDHPEAQ
ncbi:MAG: TIGR01777 family oxidoreductase, partial [Deltaproteobacteria bacterium]|nr:TIGR01777 family oxidoreductase [Deltaproteobacteria bacterium]